MTIADVDQQANISLTPQAVARGSVTLSDGASIQNIGVIALRQGGLPASFFGEAFETAAFEVGNLAPGIYDFAVVHPGYDTVEINNVQISEQSVVELGQVPLVKSGSGSSLIGEGPTFKSESDE